MAPANAALMNLRLVVLIVPFVVVCVPNDAGSLCRRTLLCDLKDVVLRIFSSMGL
jgi:hypothetical protein